MIAALARETEGRVSARALLRTASLALCLAGVAMTARGAWVPAEAEVSQVRLDRDFDRALAENAALPVAVFSPPPTAARPGSITKIAKVTMPLTVAAPEPKAAKVIAPGKPIARIEVKRLEVRNVVLAGPASHDDLAKGPTMLKRSDANNPVTVLAAHRDTHFLFIRDLREGDIVTMRYVTGEFERYRVTHFETVRWNDFAYPLDPPRPLLALTTCYPFGGTEYGGPWRRVAWAERID